TDPFGGVDHAALRRWHDLAARKGDGGNPHLLEDFAGDTRRRTVLHLPEVGGAVDRRLEPAERIRPHRLHEDRLDIDLEHVRVEFAVEVVAAALEDPRDV